MSEKGRRVRKIVDRIFPPLAGMDAQLRPINNPGTPHQERMRLVHNLLKQDTPNLDALLSDRARRRKVFRGRFIEMGIGDWKIYDNDANILYQTIKFRDNLYFRMGRMENERFVELCAKLDERQAPLDKAEYDRIDATRFFSFRPAVMTANDWDYWLRLATLTDEEAVALSLSKNPDFVSLAILKKEYEDDNRPSPFFNQYQLRLRAIQRAMTSDVFTGQLNLQRFVTWAKQSKFALPAQLMELRYPSSDTADLVDEMNPKARKTLRLMVLFMAVNKFGHQLNGNSKAPTNIIDRLAEYGIRIDNKTIRTLLTDAAEDDALAEEVELLRKRARSL